MHTEMSVFVDYYMSLTHLHYCSLAYLFIVSVFNSQHVITSSELRDIAELQWMQLQLSFSQ